MSPIHFNAILCSEARAVNIADLIFHAHANYAFAPIKKIQVSFEIDLALFRARPRPTANATAIEPTIESQDHIEYLVHCGLRAGDRNSDFAPKIPPANVQGQSR
jgi:hypothetical protein